MNPSLLSGFLRVISRNSVCCVIWNFHGGFWTDCHASSGILDACWGTLLVSSSQAHCVFTHPKGYHHHTECLRSTPAHCVPIVLPCMFQGPRFMTSEYNSKYIKESPNHPGRPSQFHLPSPAPRRLQGWSWCSSQKLPWEERRLDNWVA